MDTSFKKNLIAIAEVVLPDIQTDAKLKEDFWNNFSYFFNDLDADSSGKLKLLTGVIAKLSWVYNVKSFNKLNVVSREHYLKKISDFPVSKITAGFTGLRNLIMVSYYSMNNTWDDINYDGPIVQREIK